jgi:hypothetical protein
MVPNLRLLGRDSPVNSCKMWWSQAEPLHRTSRRVKVHHRIQGHFCSYERWMWGGLKEFTICDAALTDIDEMPMDMDGRVASRKLAVLGVLVDFVWTTDPWANGVTKDSFLLQRLPRLLRRVVRCLRHNQEPSALDVMATSCFFTLGYPGNSRVTNVRPLNHDCCKECYSSSEYARLARTISQHSQPYSMMAC